MGFPGDGGRPFPKPIEGTEKVWPADLVLLAMGFLGPEDTILQEWTSSAMNVPMSRRKRRNTRPASPVFFAAGDMRRGQSLVVWAFKEGRGAAREADRYLMGTTDLP